MRALVCLVLAGCMTDPTGASCLPVPGGDGFCGGGGGGTSHFRGWGSPSVLPAHPGGDLATSTTGDAAQVAVISWQTDGPSEDDLFTVGGGSATKTKLALDDPQAGPVQLGFAGGQEVILWSDIEGGPAYAAPLANPAQRVALGDGYAFLYRAGDRFLAAHEFVSGALDGTWLAADGTSAGPFHWTADPHDTFVGVAGGDVLALAIINVVSDGTCDLRVTRIASDGTTSAGDQHVATHACEASPIVLPDRGALVLYRGDDGEHAARIWPDGTITDLPTDARRPFRMAVRGDDILELSFDTDVSVDPDHAYDVTSRVLDFNGQVIAGPTAVGQSSFDLSIAPTGAGYAVGDGTTDDGVSVISLDPSGRVTGTFVLARSED